MQAITWNSQVGDGLWRAFEGPRPYKLDRFEISKQPAQTVRTMETASYHSGGEDGSMSCGESYLFDERNVLGSENGGDGSGQSSSRVVS